MKKTFLLIIFLVGFVITSYSQSYVGFLTDNYSGVHGVINNPASIADSKYKMDINIAGGSGLTGNDFMSFTLLDLTDDISTLETLDSRVPSDENNFFGNADILGPSVLYSLKNKKATIALFTRARVFYNVNSINGNALNTADLGIDNNESFSTQFNDTFISTNTWAEIGFTYASILINKEKHFVKGGITFKYLKGLGNAYSSSSQFNIDYDANETLEGETTPGSVTTSGDFSYGFSDNFKDNADIGPVSGAGALGLDFGLVYELRPDRETDNYTGYNKYKLKIGLSVTDIGSITYNNIEESYDVANTISQQDFENIKRPAAFRNLYQVQTTGQTTKAVLPTAFHFNADWKFKEKIYLNFNSDLSLTKETEQNRSSIANMYTLTPRYESKLLTIQTPISLQQHSGIQMGAGFRLGPIYVGSGSIITSAFNKDSKAIDIYAGVKIPFFKPVSKKPASEDKDKDKNKKDLDNDGVPDKIDKCPEIPGDEANEGCPRTDTDGDGLYDYEDKCPEIPGDEANGGCPKKIFEIQEKLDAQAKVILFNSNNTELDDVGRAALDEVIIILNENPDTKLIIEGHADSIGNTTMNQKVSDGRANSVKNYLIQKGIDRTRLTAIGYGENKPVATNLTGKGRALNRRVIIRLSN